MIPMNDRANAESASASNPFPKRPTWFAAPTRFLVIAAAAIGFTLPESARAQDTARASTKTQLSAATGWTYQLQGLDLELAVRDAADVLVIDHSMDGTAEQILAADDVEALKLKPDGSRRLVVSYMSIGEAESYRYYWDKNWTTGQRSEAVPGNPDAQVSKLNVAAADTCGATDCSKDTTTSVAPVKARIPKLNGAPSWLHHENVQWKGNYYVRFWEPEWQNIIFGTPDSYLDRIIYAGFDGVYLDRADIYAYWETVRSSSEDDMVDFIARLSTYAKERNPDFLVILQNAEELASHQDMRDAIDSVAKEDLLYGIDHTEAANRPVEIATSIRHLKRAQASGLPIFVVEYLSDTNKVENAKQRLVELGFVATFASRELDALTE